MMVGANPPINPNLFESGSREKTRSKSRIFFVYLLILFGFCGILTLYDFVYLPPGGGIRVGGRVFFRTADTARI